MERTERMLRWLYTGRLAVATAIFIAALSRWLGPDAARLETLVATVALLSAMVVTAAGLWWVELRGRAPGVGFLYGQLVFDVLLVTAVVHVTGGPLSPYPPLYILVITAAALLLPLPGGMLIGGLSSLAYIADVVFMPMHEPSTPEFLRVAIFVGVAVATAGVGDRWRRAGKALGAVESELRQLRLDTDEMLAAIDTALLTVDAKGGLVHMNAAAAELLGLETAEWTGRPVLDRLDAIAPGMGGLIGRTLATGRPVGRSEIRRGDRKDRFLGVRTTLLNREPAPWVTAVFQDITDVKQLEVLTRRAERLRAVAELGASLAHEIRNPLASIRSAVEQMAGDRLTAGDRAMLSDLVVRESERLTRLLSEFMEFSRVENRRWTEVDIGDVAMDAVGLVTRHPDRAADTRIDFCKPVTPVLLDGDHDLLHRVVFNVVLNAVQHTGENGVVTVEVDRPNGDLPNSVRVRDPVRITVRDTGPGFRDEDIPRLFDPFFTTRRGGTGLGLSMVHRAVEAHHGAILVDGGHGRGACFTIYLPARAGAEDGNGRNAE
jgi:two-component system, NtrC family, sensor histidine kinase PilS